MPWERAESPSREEEGTLRLGVDLQAIGAGSARAGRLHAAGGLVDGRRPERAARRCAHLAAQAARAVATAGKSQTQFPLLLR